MHTDKQLSEFMCKVQNVRDPFDNVQYRYYMIPEFKDGQSVLIFKTHHCMADGISVFQILCACTKEPDVNDLLMMKPVGCFQKTIIYILLPILTLIEGVYNPILSNDANPIKRNLHNEGKRIAAYNIDFKNSL